MTETTKIRAEVIEREKQHHNERFSHDSDPRSHLNKWYSSLRHGAERQGQLVLAASHNKRVLEYGCALGGISLYELKLPEKCETLTGIDISDVAVQKANSHTDRLGYKNAKFLAMNAEALEFPDQSFDVVFGRGIIHHLDTTRCFEEISRVLSKNGIAVFYEPMGYNPFINLFRKLTPEIHTPDEHPLLIRDFELAREHFGKVDVTFYGFLSTASVLLDGKVNGLPYRISKFLDEYLLRLPLVKRYAWHCLMVCRKSFSAA
jgi:SAM-dependent methyltransferase